MKSRAKRTGSAERGSFIIEFALVAPFLMLLLAGSFTVGMGLNRSIQCSQVCRNANALLARGVDLSRATNQQMLIRSASGMGFNIAGSTTADPNGKGAVILTKVIKVGPNECNLGITNWDQVPSTCTNYDQYVIAQRINIANTTRWSSQVGSPSSTPTANGTLTDAQIATISGNRATGFPGIISLSLGEFTYVSEVYADISELNFLPWLRAPGIGIRNVS